MCFSYNITYLKYLDSTKITKIITLSEKVENNPDQNTKSRWCHGSKPRDIPYFLYFYIF